MRKLVVLDGYTLNPGDLSWEGLERLGALTVHEHTPREAVLERSRGAEVLFTNKTVLGRDALEALGDLQYIGVLATGYNVVDLGVARERGVTLTNIPAYSTPSVAQTVFAHMLNVTQRVAHHAESVRQGHWSASRDFAYWDYPLIELRDMVLGIVGFGRIGRATAELGRAFGMRVLVNNRSPVQDLPEGMEEADLDRVFAESDFLSLHCPLTDENHHFVDASRLAGMKPTACLINTARGPLVDEAALAEALRDGRPATACLDVMETEPPPAGNPLFSLENCFISPHLAWATTAARQRLMDIAVRNLEAYLAGRPENVVGG